MTRPPSTVQLRIPTEAHDFKSAETNMGHSLLAESGLVAVPAYGQVGGVATVKFNM